MDWDVMITVCDTHKKEKITICNKHICKKYTTLGFLWGFFSLRSALLLPGIHGFLEGKCGKLSEENFFFFFA